MNLPDVEHCTGCAACKNICSQKCISMVYYKEGFAYPSIDTNQCISCGLCERICPVQNLIFEKKEYYPDAFLTSANDRNIRIHSASGGLFLAISIEFIRKRRGIVFGAAFDENFKVKHIGVDNVEDLPQLQKSKYVQSEIGDVYADVKKYLESGRSVLFSGTPCQIYGLKGFLGGEYPGLFCVDVICHGVPSQKVFDKYLRCQEKVNGPIVKVIHRDKQLKRKHYRAGFGIEFSNGFRYFELPENDLMAKAYFSNIADRLACYNCKFKSIWRISDLTIGDCWFSSELGGMEDTSGVTLAFVQSRKGRELLNLTDTVTKIQVDSERAVKVNGGMIYSSPNLNPRREDFFEQLDKQEFEDLVDEFIPGSKSRFSTIISKFKDYDLIPSFLLKWKKQKEFCKRLKRQIPENAFGLLRLDKNVAQNKTENYIKK